MRHAVDKLDLKEKRVCILGLQGSGKSYLAKYIIMRTKRVFVIDPLNEYQIVDRYKNRNRLVLTETTIPEIVMDTIENDKMDLLVIDEISRFAPTRRQENKRLRDFADACRHHGTTFMAIARRPAQVYVDYVELAHYLFIFRLRGKNDSHWMDNQAEGLTEAVHALKRFEFVCLNPDRSFQVFPPVAFDSIRPRNQKRKRLDIT